MSDNFSNPLTEESITNRPISVTVGKLVLASVVISLTTWIGALIAPLTGVSETWKISAVGCIAGLWLVEKSIFANAELLDRIRWRHHWFGDLLGYWFTLLLLTYAWSSRIQKMNPNDIGELFFAETMTYIIASVIGCVIGLLNVKRCDASDKKIIVDRIWRTQKEKTL